MLQELDPPSRSAQPPPIRRSPVRARGYPLVGLLPGMLRDAPNLLLDLARRHPGELLELALGPTRVYLATHPDQVQYIFTDHWRNYTKEAEMWRPLRRLLSNGLATADGDGWLRNRRLMQPLFSQRQLAGLVDIMVSVVRDDVERIERLAREGAVVDMDRLMMQLTQRVILATMFGTNITAGEVDSLGQAILSSFKVVNTRMFLSFVPDRLLPGERVLRGAIDRIDGMIHGIVAERRRSGEERSDLLSLLLGARDDSGSGMNDRQLRDELVTMFVAGNETTAVTMTWLFYLLDQHPDVERKVRAELDEVIGDRPPTAADLSRFEYTRMVINETMRLYPPSWIVPREAKEADQICGYSVPAGATVLVSQYVMHRDPAFWESPSVFDPGRFTPERSATRPRYSFVPFGAGPRQCIGNMFSIMEAQIIVALLLRKIRARLVPGQTVSPRAATALRPSHGLKMKLHPSGA